MIAGRYSLEREIGRGGMGAVWLGRDELLGRMVALKQIGRLPGADSADLARAEREARLAARLNHPHVVAVYDLVVDGEARWLVMEYVDGSTLAQLVEERGRLSPDDAAPLLHQAADALVAGHAAGIVHRDVKPSNILVDQDGRVKLTDFGIARVAADPALTQTGMVIGSPAYLPPEVAAGQRGDESGDVWSLGATTFHVLSGRPPYEIGDQVIGGLYRIVNEDPPRLAEAGWMTALLEATMVKDPSRRWSMAQVRDFLAGPSGGVAPTTPIDAAAAAHQVEETTPTRMLGTLRESAPQEAARPGESPAQRPPHDRKGGMLVGLVGVALALVLALVLFAVLHNRQPNTSAHKPPASPTKSSSSSGTPSSHHTASTGPTARGMKSFVRSYVAAVASDPNTAWDMLTPKFQRQSGGLDTYRKFWSGVGHGQLLTVSADPRNLVVSYRVRFQNFGTGRRPTVLDLVFDHGRYLINGEHNDGFVPAS